MTAREKTKHALDLSQWNFVARWVIGQALVLAVCYFLFQLLSNIQFDDIGEEITFIFFSFVALVISGTVGFVFVQKNALMNLTGLTFNYWRSGSSLAIIVSLIWFWQVNTGFDDLLFSYGIPLDRMSLIEFSPLVILPVLIQTWVLKEYVSQTWVYAVSSIIMGYCIVFTLVSNTLILIIPMVIGILYLIVTALIIYWLFENHRIQSAY